MINQIATNESHTKNIYNFLRNFRISAGWRIFLRNVSLYLAAFLIRWLCSLALYIMVAIHPA